MTSTLHIHNASNIKEASHWQLQLLGNKIEEPQCEKSWISTNNCKKMENNWHWWCRQIKRVP